MYAVTYDKTFTFKVTASFGGLSESLINKMFTDGRVASKFLEEHIPLWFPDLEFKDGRGYDHLHKINLRKFDQKCFTENGLIYAPSNMLGAGRKIVSEVAHQHANEIDYIACDIIDFPVIRIRFVKGADLVKKYPTFKIKRNQRDEFFG
jgi:hypothetical protein